MAARRSLIRLPTMLPVRYSFSEKHLICRSVIPSFMFLGWPEIGDVALEHRWF